MLAQELLVCVIMGLATAVAPIPHQRQTIDESLRGALDAISRKQRSLDPNPQEYYNDLRSFKYHGGEPERKFDREHQGDTEIDQEDEEIEFLPNETGQLETVGNGYQDLNNKILERTLIDYLESIPQQEEEPTPSIFRERERSSSRKRVSEQFKILNRKDLEKLVMGGLHDYNIVDPEDAQYILDAHQMLNSGPMSWGELLNKESMVIGPRGREIVENEFGEQDPSMGERKMNGGYPLGRFSQRTYGNMAKRYPVAKRSPRPMSDKKQATDPKVAEDLGALFGPQSMDNQNRSNEHDHDHSHDHNHEHDHEQHKQSSSSEAPKVTPPPKGQKENGTKLTKSKSIDVRKKSIDWSQYFGIDRRRKKATLLAGGQGTQNQDDDWMLQRYYENMVENMQPIDREYEKGPNERKEQQEWMKKIVRDLIRKQASRNADSEEGEDLQKVKDRVMMRLAVHSFEKMKKALDELKSYVAARIEAQKAYVQDNQTSNFRENKKIKESKSKRINNDFLENEGIEEISACPELFLIEKQCRSVATLAGDESLILLSPCVTLHICKACVQDEFEQDCFNNYAIEAGKICLREEIRKEPKGTEACARTASILAELRISAQFSNECRIDGEDACLRLYHERYSHI